MSIIRVSMLAAAASMSLASAANADLILSWRQGGSSVSTIEVDQLQSFDLELWATITSPTSLVSGGYDLSVTGAGASFQSINLNDENLPLVAGPHQFAFLATPVGGLGVGEYLLQTLTFQAGALGTSSAITFTYDLGNPFKYFQGTDCPATPPAPLVNVTSVPAPSAFALLASGAFLTARRRRRE